MIHAAIHPPPTMRSLSTMEAASSFLLASQAMRLRKLYSIQMDSSTQMSDVRITTIFLSNLTFNILLSKGERWQYVILPLSPSKASAWSSSDMGSVGWVSSGGVIYNHLSSTDGSLAAYYEIETLDTCGGHSNEDMEYHYHLVSLLNLK